MLDTDLAFSPYGVLLAQRLGEELDLWLARELWHILDNADCYVRSELALGGHGATVPEAERFRAILRQWEWARTASDLNGFKLFWVGDARYESRIPSGVDPHLVHRFEKLAACCEPESAGTGAGNDPFADSYRDAAALTAALSPYRAFILTTRPGDGASPDDEAPAICSRIASIIGKKCSPLERDNLFLQEYLLPILLRAGINELIWGGLKLAAVHLLVPEAVVMPPPEKEEGYFEEDLEPAQRPQNWWSGASCFWYPIDRDESRRWR